MNASINVLQNDPNIKKLSEAIGSFNDRMREALRAGLQGETTDSHMKTESLTETIAQYRAGMTDFNENAPEDDADLANAYGEATWGGPFDKLKQWKEPARSGTDAINALQLAIDELTDFDPGGPALALVTAAMGYFKPQTDVSDELKFLIKFYEEVQAERRPLDDALEAMAFDQKRPGYNKIAGPEEKLFGTAMWLEKRIAFFPCSSVGDVLGKAVFAKKWLVDDECDSDYRSKLLDTISQYAAGE